MQKHGVKQFFYFLLVLVIEYVCTIAAFLLFGLLKGISYIINQDIKAFEMREASAILVSLIILSAPIAYNIIHGKRKYKKGETDKMLGYIIVSIILISIIIF